MYIKKNIVLLDVPRRKNRIITRKKFDISEMEPEVKEPEVTITNAPASDDAPPEPPKENLEPTENNSWWGGWTGSAWAKTITGKNLFKKYNNKKISNFLWYSP
jgi:hypothetical protein